MLVPIRVVLCRTGAFRDAGGWYPEGSGLHGDGAPGGEATALFLAPVFTLAGTAAQRFCSLYRESKEF